jgi:hypothetical protein
MNGSRRRTLARWLLLSALVCVAWTPRATAGPGAGLNGAVIGVDGRPAAGMRVHLIDREGGVRAIAPTADDGRYAIRGLPAGRYAVGIEDGRGHVAPVSGPGVLLEEGELAQHDVRLLRADQDERNRAATGNYGLGMWWTGLTTPAKVWTVLGVVTVGAITYVAVTGEDSQASPFEPTTP